ncbi:MULTISPECIES: ABC transporter permease [Rhodomicrobium]|uniref:ABC transporter permease n=1 Tax=Rhodomicrobium TaxID=1068 RepID=UPI000B4AA54C|nr:MULTISPECIES: ABC transporter permease [Rhodomicrobium]
MHYDTALDVDGPAASLRRIAAMVRRYAFLILGSVPRMVELMYWPLVQMLVWGFLQMHLAATTSLFANAAGLLIGSVLLWDILLRGQFGFSLSFLEEMWSRNLVNILMSPLRPNEYIAALMVISLIRLAISMVPVVLLAYLFFDFNLLGLGLPLAGFFANLVICGWTIGLVANGVIIRYGMGAESFTWVAVFFLLPLCCVYYPLSTLPPWLQPLAAALPPTHVFEGLRALVMHGEFHPEQMIRAFALNVVYFSGAYILFHYCLRLARIKGTLMQIGE